MRPGGPVDCLVATAAAAAHICRLTPYACQRLAKLFLPSYWLCCPAFQKAHSPRSGPGAWTSQMPSNRGQPTKQPERRGRQQPSLSRRKVGPAGGGASGGEGAAAQAMTISDLPDSLLGTVLARLGRKR